MLKVNGNIIEVVKSDVNLNEFDGVIDGIKKQCRVLYVNVTTNELDLCIETNYDIEWIKDLNNGEICDISKYFIGLSYEDKNGWMYLTNKCNFTICKTNDDKYEINLNGHFEECNEQLDIEYSDKVVIL